MGAAKQEDVRRWAPDERGSSGAHPTKPEFIEAEAVDDDGAFIEGVVFGESKYFGGALGIDTFREMNDERLVGRRGPLLERQIMIQRDRMGPREVAKDADNEAVVEELWKVRVVMAYGRDTAEQISNPTPPESGIFPDGSMLADRGGFGSMNVIGPLDEVAVSALAEPRKQSEFQVIVGVYKAWKQQETT